MTFEIFVFPAEFVFSKINMFLLPSLSNMIVDSASHWVNVWWDSGPLI